MKIGSKGTLYVGSDRYAYEVVAKVNDKTFVGVHIKDDGECWLGSGSPMVAILRLKNNGEWREEESLFVEGDTINYIDPSH
jgi:hypothetical protein